MSSLKLSLFEKIQWKIQRFGARIVGLLCECRWRWVKNIFIRGFIYAYQPDLKDCIRTRVQEYTSLNDFFTRQLRPESRPLPKSLEYVISPVDGCISQMGVIQNDVLLQAKGKTYTLQDLLAGDEDSVRLFRNGYFYTFYLDPADYHRVHMPVAGNALHTTYVPGFLFSVGARNTQAVSQLFTRNERLLNLFDTALGPLMIIQIGSSLVGHMGTVWEAKDTAPRRNKAITRIQYAKQQHRLERADEMGYFKMGSTVILLFAEGKASWEDNLYVGKRLRYGQSIGKVLPRGIEPLFMP